MSKLSVFACFPKIEYRLSGEPYRYPWFLQKEARKRNGRGKEKEREKERERENEKGKENDWEEEKEKKRKGNEKEKKRKGKGKEKERKRKEREKERSKGRGRGKTEEKIKGSICGLLWGYFLTNGYREGIARGMANLASCMYVTLCKTTSDVDIMHALL